MRGHIKKRVELRAQKRARKTVHGDKYIRARFKQRVLKKVKYRKIAGRARYVFGGFSRSKTRYITNLRRVANRYNFTATRNWFWLYLRATMGLSRYFRLKTIRAFRKNTKSRVKHWSRKFQRMLIYYKKSRRSRSFKKYLLRTRFIYRSLVSTLRWDDKKNAYYYTNACIKFLTAYAKNFILRNLNKITAGNYGYRMKLRIFRKIPRYGRRARWRRRRLSSKFLNLSSILHTEDESSSDFDYDLFAGLSFKKAVNLEADMLVLTDISECADFNILTNIIENSNYYKLIRCINFFYIYRFLKYEIIYLNLYNYKKTINTLIINNNIDKLLNIFVTKITDRKLMREDLQCYFKNFINNNMIQRETITSELIDKITVESYSNNDFMSSNMFTPEKLVFEGAFKNKVISFILASRRKHIRMRSLGAMRSNIFSIKRNFYLETAYSNMVGGTDISTGCIQALRGVNTIMLRSGEISGSAVRWRRFRKRDRRLRNKRYRHHFSERVFRYRTAAIGILAAKWARMSIKKISARYRIETVYVDYPLYLAPRMFGGSGYFKTKMNINFDKRLSETFQYVYTYGSYIDKLIKFGDPLFFKTFVRFFSPDDKNIIKNLKIIIANFIKETLDEFKNTKKKNNPQYCYFLDVKYQWGCLTQLEYEYNHDTADILNVFDACFMYSYNIYLEMYKVVSLLSYCTVKKELLK